MQKLKVLVVIADQFRADLLTGAMAAHVDLPNIRAFQADATSFERHYSVTNPCGPSRASILTGLYAMNHRSVRNGTPLAAGTRNLAHEVRKLGYEPWLFGYTDTPQDPTALAPADPRLNSEEEVMDGFREMLEMRLMESFPWRAHLGQAGYDLPDYAHFYDPISPDPARPPRPDDPPFYRAEHSDTAFLTDRLLADLAVHRDKAWFALATWIRPHPPLVAPAPYNKMYDPASLPLPPRLASPADEAAVHPFMAGAIQAPRMQDTVTGCPVDDMSDTDLQTLRAVYLGLATEVDTHFGRILDWLKQTGQYDDTLLIFMADHGEMLGEHHQWGKQTPYENAWAVPLLIRDPRRKATHGTRIRAFTESTDIVPTILDLLGGPIPSGLDGRSLKPFLDGETPPDWRDAVHMELEYGEPDGPTARSAATGTALNQSNLAILREETWKLVHFNGDLPPLLFNLENDPDELCNLAPDPAHADQLLRLTRKLLSHRMAHQNRRLTGWRIDRHGPREYPQS